MHYQPLVDAKAGRFCGMEALLRCQSPTRGAVSPAQFIPVAESSGLIAPITDWVLNTALRESQSLRQSSSLAYLTGLPCTELKIDRSFVMKMLTDERSETIVRAVTNLAHTLGLDVVAEGVEDEVALKVLGELGCDRAQGFLFGRPMPIDDLELVDWLASGTWKPRKSG